MREIKFKDYFEIKEKDIITLTGGGGKTTLMFKLAEELSEVGRVLVTTTTKIYTPEKNQYKDFIIHNKKIINGSNKKNITILASEIDIISKKILGITDDLLEKYIKDFDYILIEGDGSRSKPLKVWNREEPIISKFSKKIIGITNIKAIGESIKNIMHRYEISNYNEDILVDEKLMIDYLENGSFFKEFIFNNNLKKYFFLNGVENEELFNSSLEIFSRLKKNKKYEKIKCIFGSLHKNEAYLYRNISAVILASGFSRRLGENKLFLKYKNKTLLLDTLERLENIGFFNNYLIISKENYEKLEEKNILNKYSKIQVHINNFANKGQSESVKIGVSVSQKEETDYMFFTIDQPFLRKETILKIIKEHLMKFNDTKSERIITVPHIDDSRYSPVIFSNFFTNELLKISGDTGGKEIIKKYPNFLCKVEFLENTEFKDIDEEEDLKLLK